MIAARYSVMRVLIFVGFFALFRLVRLDVIWAAVAAAVVSMVVSYFLLAPDRQRMAAGLERRVEDRVAKRRAQAEAERVDEED
ncbi:hypothetical protein SGUI_1417 [Serinicoccus hydrothermalis]|uniref:DUF4229 domain-containing protein n=1 Tax=Serinicoccus hydrothermalis TaxID=1758689 RepID=A0A1B1NBK9_9MICO|nr:DUF4229 domain-containing protein [Serinicoccus hydrothermalis]ANS78813.1 hypothetical protein SGUI_1417 [Serinicoccus hydrothermalis]